MCFNNNLARISDAAQGKARRVDNAAPVVTGRQTGVEDPIDTSKVTKRLKKQRGQGKEGQKVFVNRGRSPFDLKI